MYEGYKISVGIWEISKAGWTTERTWDRFMIGVVCWFHAENLDYSVLAKDATVTLFTEIRKLECCLLLSDFWAKCVHWN